jgi:F0F1-type ATP synthase membrane subunit c/vacuolar-type H+-ATPase subunit K
VSFRSERANKRGCPAPALLRPGCCRRGVAAAAARGCAPGRAFAAEARRAERGRGRCRATRRRGSALRPAAARRGNSARQPLLPRRARCEQAAERRRLYRHPGRCAAAMLAAASRSTSARRLLEPAERPAPAAAARRSRAAPSAQLHRDLCPPARAPAVASLPTAAVAHIRFAAPSLPLARPPIQVIFCEATAIYGVILAILLANKTVLPQNGMPTDPSVLAGYLRVARFASYSMLWSGLGVGLTNLGSGICEGKRERGRRGTCVCASGHTLTSRALRPATQPNPTPPHLPSQASAWRALAARSQTPRTRAFS